MCHVSSNTKYKVISFVISFSGMSVSIASFLCWAFLSPRSQQNRRHCLCHQVAPCFWRAANLKCRLHFFLLKGFLGFMFSNSKGKVVWTYECVVCVRCVFKVSKPGLKVFQVILSSLSLYLSLSTIIIGIIGFQ